MELSSSDMVLKCMNHIDDIKRMATQVYVNRVDFVMMAYYLVELRPFLEELNKLQGFLHANPSWPSLQQLSLVLEGMNMLAKSCSSSSRIYLLCHSHGLSQNMCRYFKQIAQCVDLILSECQDIPPDCRKTANEKKEKFRSSNLSEEPSYVEIASQIQSCLKCYREATLNEEEQCERATELLQSIGEHMNIPICELNQLKIELQEHLRIAEAEQRKEDLHDLRDLCSFFDLAKTFGSNGLFESPEFQTHETMNSFEIPKPFFCPITREVMHEPVMLEQGHTYERAAIVEWLQRGNRTCPVTGQKLNTLELIPNVKLKEAMDEYFSNMHKGELIHVIQELRHQDAAMQTEELINKVKAILDTDPQYKRLLVSLDGIRPLVALIRPSKPKIRERILRILYNISVLGDDYKLSVLSVNAISVLLRLLQKSPGDNGGPLQLLWELSKLEAGSKAILSEKGSILIIASAFSLCQNDQKVLAEKLMWNLCYYDKSVIIEAARSSIFGPLIAALTSGDDDLKLKLVTSITSSLDLNDHNGSSLVKEGVLPPLLDLLQFGSTEIIKEAAGAALHRLSAIDLNKSSFAKNGAIPIFVKLLDTPFPQVKINVLATLSNLATDRQNTVAINQEGGVMHHLGMLLSEDTVMQEYSLKTLQCMAKDSHIVRACIADLKMVPTLYRLLQNQKLSAYCQASVLELLCYLAEDYTICDTLRTSTEMVKFLIGLLEGGTNSERKETTLTLLAGLSRLGDMKQKIITAETDILSLASSYLGMRGSSKLKESAALILSQLCDPDLIGVDALKRLSGQGLIPVLIGILHNNDSTEETKHSAVITLKCFSKCTPCLSERQPWFKNFMACLGVKKFKTCQVHAGKCSVKGTFCIVEANTIPLLINLVKEGGTPISEEAAEVLYTLLINKENTSQGVDFLMMNGILPVLVSIVGKNDVATEKAAKIMEVIFRRKKYRDDQYSKLVKGSLATILATGSADARKFAAIALMHLKEMPRDSVYTFTTASTST